MPRSDLASPDTRATRRRSSLALLLLAAPLVLGLCLRADAHGVTLFGISGPTCAVGESFGQHACPGCGLTRSTALLLDGAWAEATLLHPAGWLVVLLCAAGLVIHTDILRRGRRTAGHVRLLRWGRWTFAGGIVLAWLLRWAVLGP